MEVVLGSARPPRMPSNLTRRRDERQSRGKKGICVVFFMIESWNLQSVEILLFIYRVWYYPSRN